MTTTEGTETLLRQARLQLEYLDERFPTGTTPAIIARIDRALSRTPPPPSDEDVERAALAAWIAYSVRDEDLDDEDEFTYNRSSAIRDWNENPTGCTHIGADGFRLCARAALAALSPNRSDTE